MPIYDYVCSSCRHLTEVVHGIHDTGPRFCPACGADGTMRKALSTPAIHFKGSGWAKKDRSSTSGARTKAAGHSADAGSADGSADGSSAASATAGSSEPAKGSTGPATGSGD